MNKELASKDKKILPCRKMFLKCSFLLLKYLHLKISVLLYVNIDIFWLAVKELSWKQNNKKIYAWI